MKCMILYMRFIPHNKTGELMGTAVLKNKEDLGNDSYKLTFEVNEGLGFLGGQYIIIDSKMPIDEKKNYKRAYSIISSESEQRRFSLVYKRISNGIVTNGFLNEIKAGTEIQFSGPWGKFLKEEEYAKEGENLILATDTGIVSAISFLQSAKIKDRLQEVTLKWFVPSDDYFLKFDLVKALIPKNIGNFEIITCPEYGVDRTDKFYTQIENVLRGSSAKSFYLCGDGRVVKNGRALLLEEGVPDVQIGTQTYFNKEAV